MVRTLLVALLMLAACSAPTAESIEPSAAPTSTVDPTQSPSPSPSVRPSPFDAELGAAYLAIEEAWTEVQCSRGADLEGQSVEAIRMSGRISAGTARVFGDALRKLDFPIELQQAQEDMLRALSALELSSEALGEVATAEEFAALRDQQTADLEAAISQSDVIREELGLESAPESC